MEDLLRPDRCHLRMGHLRTREDFLIEGEGALRGLDARLREHLLLAHLSPTARRTSNSLRAPRLLGLLQGAPIPLRTCLRPLHPEQGDRSILPHSVRPLPPMGE